MPKLKPQQKYELITGMLLRLIGVALHTEAVWSGCSNCTAATQQAVARQRIICSELDDLQASAENGNRLE